MKKTIEKSVLVAIVMEAVAFIMMGATMLFPVLMDYNVGLVGLCVAMLGLVVVPATAVDCFVDKMSRM